MEEEGGREREPMTASFQASAAVAAGGPCAYDYRPSPGAHEEGRREEGEGSAVPSAQKTAPYVSKD